MSYKLIFIFFIFWVWDVPFKKEMMIQGSVVPLDMVTVINIV